MKKIIYVKLLGEGTEVYRPVPAVEVEKGIFRIMFLNNYDSEDETWEFLPGTFVLVKEKKLSGENVLIAVKEHKI